MVWMTFEGQPHWLSRFPQPLLCLDLILEDIMDFCMVSEEFEFFYRKSRRFPLIWCVNTFV